MLKKYQQHPQVLRRVSKYFFCENVYDDDSTDRPKPRWRFRNLYKEDLASAHMKSDDDSYSKRINSEKTDLRKTDIQRKQINVSMQLCLQINLNKNQKTLGMWEICYTRMYLLCQDDQISFPRPYKLVKSIV